MAIDWKTIISEFDGKPTLLQAIVKLRKAVEDETITIQQAQAEIAKLESQQKADEALITTAQTTANNAQSAAQAADTKAQQALDLATTNEQDIAKLDSEMVGKVDKIEIGLGDIVYGVSDNKQTHFAVAGRELKPLSIVRRDQNANIISNSFLLPSGAKFGANSFITKEGKSVSYPEPSGNTYFATIESVLNIVNNLKFKTLFGTERITGSGNIDLYKHVIEFTEPSDNKKSYAVFYSSNSLKCDSLENLKTILGNTFILPISGQLGLSTIAEYATNENLYGIYLQRNPATEDMLKTVPYSGFTITDTVTTI